MRGRANALASLWRQPNKPPLPILFLTKASSLPNKMDELRLQIVDNNNVRDHHSRSPINSLRSRLLMFEFQRILMLIQLSGIYIAALLTSGFRERMLVRFGCCFSFQQSLLKPANCTVLLISYLALVAPGAFKFSTMLLPSLHLSRRGFPVDCYSPHIHGPPLHILATSPTSLQHYGNPTIASLSTVSQPKTGFPHITTSAHVIQTPIT